ncbi:SRPBCC family protein [Pseudonocardia pini]|uniref:SRPBCC family protein n=1 Tax=Pseudonocardia pini TaxID=2758030 RepID=UPI0015F110EE|nr:SRPBCC domain-containing protein [Pseudonocardia pini]
MTVISTERDADQLTLTFVAEFAAPVERVWQVWADARQLERWWGPPTWPATFEVLELAPGGRASYYMTGPEGEKSRGWWRITAADEPNRLEFEDGFADENGTPSDSMPTTTAVVTLEATATGTRMVTLSRFTSLEQMEQLVQMGMEEGMRQAMGQIDALLA